MNDLKQTLEKWADGMVQTTLTAEEGAHEMLDLLWPVIAAAEQALDMHGSLDLDGVPTKWALTIEEALTALRETLDGVK
jgi:hypothetical protein